MDGVTVLGKLQNECWARQASWNVNKSPLYKVTSWNSSQSLLAIFYLPKTHCMVKIC